MSISILTTAKVLAPLIAVAIAVGFGAANWNFISVAPDHHFPGKVSSFTWKSDLSGGVAVSFPVRRNEQTCRGVVVAELSDSLGGDWEIRGARAFTVDNAGRHSVVSEGPYLQGDTDDTWVGAQKCKWHLYEMTAEQYEVEILLHRKTERLTFFETKGAILANNGIRVGCVQ